MVLRFFTGRKRRAASRDQDPVTRAKSNPVLAEMDRRSVEAWKQGQRVRWEPELKDPNAD